MKILILEDNKFDSDLAKRHILNNIKDCHIEIAVSIAEAKKLINVKYDIALLDIKLPDGFGTNFLIELRKINKKTAIIMLTGSEDEEFVVTALKSGADDYIVKKEGYLQNLSEIILHNLTEKSKRNKRSLETIKVLYLEHHSPDIDLTIRHFKKTAPQFHFHTMRVGEDALKLLEGSSSKSDPFDLLLMDYNLPGINAIEITKIIRQKRKSDIPIVIVTGQGNEDVAIEALKFGADDYLVKRENYLNRLPYLLTSTHQRRILKNQKRELTESESKYRILFEDNPQPMWIYDIETLDFLEVNTAAVRHYGHSKEEFLSMNLKDIRPGDEVSKFLSDLRKKKNTNFFMGEWIHCKKNGDIIIVEITSHSITFNGKQARHVLVNDITDKKIMIDELITAKEKAEESDRLKSAFLANMSHEIRTPMNGILGFAGLLNEPGLTGEKQNEYIKIIEKAGARMLNIINDIVSISKIESGESDISLTDININNQVDFVYDLFKPDAESKGLNFSILNGLPDNESIIKSDKEKLFAILANLVKNAIKYTTEGEIEFGYSKKAQFLEFFIKDTGIGIPKDRQLAIFDRFIQADIEDKMARQGAGLGLSISKAYVNMLGGEIWVESQEGIGSTFYFTLPYHTLTKENNIDIFVEPDEAPSNITEPEVSGLKILIAEDDDVSEMFLQLTLDVLCKEILKARTGKEAVEACRLNTDIDLVMMDILMPHMDGYEATREIRKFNKDVVIIAQTAYGLSGDREKALEAGCNDYIAKPIDKTELLELIQKYFK